MAYRELEISNISAKNLKQEYPFLITGVWIDVEMKEKDAIYTASVTKTEVEKKEITNPNWTSRIVFPIREDLSQRGASLIFKLHSKWLLVRKLIGTVSVPLSDLVTGGNTASQSYAITSQKGKTRGTLTISYKIGETITPPPPPPMKAEPVMAYPAPGFGNPGPGYPYPHPPPTAYPPPPHGAYPPQPPHGAYPPPPPPQYGGYAYPPAYGNYHQPQPVYQPYPQPSKKPGIGKMGLAAGAGLLGGLLVGDAISDVAEMGAYEEGFADGLDF